MAHFLLLSLRFAIMGPKTFELFKKYCFSFIDIKSGPGPDLIYSGLSSKLF